MNWKPGDKVIYTGYELNIHGEIVEEVEGWWRVRFPDDSTAIVRPSFLKPA